MHDDYIHCLREHVGQQPIILNFAGGILTNPQGEVLLQHRTDFDAWGLPGGALELGESQVEACQREFKEETGLDVQVTQLLGSLSKAMQRYPNGDAAQCIVTFFKVEEISGALQAGNAETSELAYFSLEELPEIFSPQHQAVLDYYRQGQFPFYD
ncbi:NUDIX domain-containing protein [Weissella viridescens]|uniref:NUDIX domain-containing protein n=2 Tax=Weissella viridescens TaxID=1629 RepID=A0A3P2RHK0_WEIVI|nr:NUDIX hydrolase [Weissella viridescens]RRG18891.1 NUDIX domain-containing protein [Weissella viridescens]